jgi:predicted CXXCH cytochrome family protein
VRPKGEEICLSCHNLEEIRGGSHPPIERASCVLCHQGHRSERGALLRPGIPSQRYPQTISAAGADPAPTSRPEGGQRR